MPFVQPKEINQNPDIFQSPPQPDAQRPQSPDCPCSTNIVDQTTQHSNILIDGVVSTAPVQVLVDTGAAVIIISGEFYHKVISTSSPLQVSQMLQSVKKANGTHIPIEGVTTFNLLLGQTNYSCNAFVVSGLSYSVVLGRDFLKQNRAIINTGAQTVEFLGNNVLRFANEHPLPTHFPVKCFKTEVIDAHCEAVLPVTADSPTNNVIGLIEPVEKLLDRYHLAGTASLVCPGTQETIPFQLLNPTEKRVTVFRGFFCEVPHWNT